MNFDDVRKLYEEYFPTQVEDTSYCECGNTEFVLDNHLYYLVCDTCGQCQDINKEYCVNYNDMSRYVYVSKRYYKRSSYLRSKIRNLLHSHKPILDEVNLKVLKKKVKTITINQVTKFIKKKKLIKQFDPIKTFFHLKQMKPPNLNDIEINQLICEFKKKETVYKQNNYKRFNYNFLLLKIFEEWGREDLVNCIKVLQDNKRIEHHEIIYLQLFPIY